jgi:hypothetical protein
MAKPVNKRTAQPHRPQTVQGKKNALPRKPQASQRQTTTPRNPLKQWLLRVCGFKSILLAGVLTFVVYAIFTKNDGYKWVTINYLKGNWEHIRKYPDATLDQRNEMKLGFNYVFLNHIVKNTPDTAVILFPQKEYITEKGGDMQLSNDVTVKIWATHFVYPRRVVYKDDKDIDPFYDKVTHVAICAAHGYEDLDYFVQQRTYFDVLPKKQLTANE